MPEDYGDQHHRKHHHHHICTRSASGWENSLLCCCTRWIGWRKKIEREAPPLTTESTSRSIHLGPGSRKATTMYQLMMFSFLILFVFPYLKLQFTILRICGPPCRELPSCVLRSQENEQSRPGRQWSILGCPIWAFKVFHTSHLHH